MDLNVLSICCNTMVSDEIFMNILVPNINTFYLSNASGIHNVELFFSIISQEEKHGSINEKTENESSSGNDIPSSISQWLEGNLTSVKSLFSHWVALTTINGALACEL